MTSQVFLQTARDASVGGVFVNVPIPLISHVIPCLCLLKKIFQKTLDICAFDWYTT